MVVLDIEVVVLSMMLVHSNYLMKFDWELNLITES